MGFMESLEANLAWTTVSNVCIVDWQLALMSIFMKVAVLFYVVFMVVLGQQYLHGEEPSGTPTFWFDKGGLLAEQAAGGQAYCDGSGSHDYRYGLNPGYWDDVNIQCANPDYAAMYRKGVADAFALTFYKQEHVNKMPCAGVAEGAACSSMQAAAPAGGRGNTNAVINGVCSCGKLQDMFAVGVEEMSFTLQHGFRTSGMFNYAQAASTADTDDHATGGKLTIKSCIFKYPRSDECKGSGKHPVSESKWEKCCLSQYEPGVDIGMKIGQWLDIAGISLDDRAESVVDKDPATNLRPYRRTCGVKLLVHMKYFGRIDHPDTPILCEIDVEAVDSWVSEGAPAKYMSFANENEQEYYDQYRRGIRFEFAPSGIVNQFDIMTFINQLVSAVVFFGLADKVTAFYAQAISPRRRLYKKAINSRLNYSNELAKFGANMALACTTFKKWTGVNFHREPEKDDVIDCHVLAKVYAPYYMGEQAEQMAATVIHEATKGKSNTLNFTQLCDILSPELVSIDRFKYLSSTVGSKVMESPAHLARANSGLDPGGRELILSPKSSPLKGKEKESDEDAASGEADTWRPLPGFGDEASSSQRAATPRETQVLAPMVREELQKIQLEENQFLRTHIGTLSRRLQALEQRYEDHEVRIVDAGRIVEATPRSEAGSMRSNFVLEDEGGRKRPKIVSKYYKPNGV